MSIAALVGRYYDASRTDPSMTALSSETLDGRTATLDAPRARVAYDIREAEGESNRAVLLMIGSPMDSAVHYPRTAPPRPDRRDVRPARGLAQRANRRQGAHAGGARGCVLRVAADWMDRQRDLWERRFDVVDDYVKEDESL